jgi:hypothetical protein
MVHSPYLPTIPLGYEGIVARADLDEAHCPCESEANLLFARQYRLRTDHLFRKGFRLGVIV